MILKAVIVFVLMCAVLTMWRDGLMLILVILALIGVESLIEKSK